MVGSIETLVVVYGAAYAATAVLTGTLGYWVSTRTRLPARRWFGALMGVLFLWTLVSTPRLFVADPTLEQGLQVVGAGLGLSAVLVWVVFATSYAGHDPHEMSVVSLFGVAYLVLLGVLVTDPVHDLYYATAAFDSQPFPHRATGPGPGRILAFGYAFAGLGLGTHYLTQLFLNTRYRLRQVTLLLSVAVLAGIAPIAASVFGITPIPTYDHTVFGVSGFALVVAYATLRHSLNGLSPVARDVVVDEVGDPILVVDADALLVDYNDAAAALGPALDADSIGTDLREVLPGLTDAVDVTAAGQHEEVQLPVGEQPRYYSVRVSEIGGASPPAGYVILLRDITGRKAREQQLEATTRELERSNERLEDFVSVVSHDLRNPLNVATLELELAREDRDDEHLEQVARAHERMETLIENLLTLAREGAAVTDRREVSLAAVADRCAETVDTGDATVVVEADGAVEADPERLRQLFENLFRNAVEHGPDDATVTVGEFADGFYVADDGPGIPEGARERVFERGHSQSGSTGLGLPIVAEIAEAHGWTVSVTESEVGGARVEFDGVASVD